MFFLVDTCSILMLIRICPDMFTDIKYNCFTINEIIREVVQTKKFKDKYPWRNDIKSNLRPIPREKAQSPRVTQLEGIIRIKCESITVDIKTNKVFNLSATDQKLAACALANEFHTCSEDGPVVSFCAQEFPSVYKGNLCALEIINHWLKAKLLVWDDQKHAYLQDWRVKNEPVQSAHAIADFQSLTGRVY